MPYPVDRPATWLVTGASRGLGLALVRALLASGCQVVATTRSSPRLHAALAEVDTSRLLALEVDLVDPAAVTGAVQRATQRFGNLDVVVNNAGYGFLGAVEETTDAQVAAMLDVQVRGTWNVVRAALPVMREARSGHLVTISSVLGVTSFPGWGLYCAAKFAVEGLTESLAAEVTGFGISVNLVEPGYFDTSFLTADSLSLSDTHLDGYEAVRDMVRQHQQMPGTQLGDPDRAAEALIALARADGAGRLRQALGSDSLQIARTALAARLAELEEGAEVARSTDHDRG
ncbi:SDR family NAD(P)-dependent oxidoreductase [Kineococcus sp. T13]|uniref:SDR family NAD(P)-dependent oxidoreductase n=1 Tax=Kineococcus vitellinus TaxID=2696565 RepID=UPI0014130E3E|nr:SDR family NAD(P)-dependent oxidoreductase [Kineococcus vitellinus]NAZ75213.1 SDR family NAD(P)-dependent oxidoreductase [Kineococcus vitellinus]